MEAFFVVLVVVILLIRGLAKLGAGSDEPSRPRAPRRATKPPKKPKVPRGPTRVPRGASHKSPSASPKPGQAKTPKLRRPIFGRRKTPEGVEAPPAQAPGSETYVRYLVDVLRVGEPAASRQAVERLVELGRPALPTLQEAARDPSPFVRERVQQASRRILEALALAGQAGGSERLEEQAIPMPPPLPREPRPALFDRRESEPAVEPEAESTPEPVPEPAPEPVPPRADEPAAEVPEEPAPDAPPDAPPAEAEALPAAPAAPVDGSEIEAIAKILTEAAAEPGFGGRRDEILEPLKLVIAHFTVIAGRVQWTGSFGVSEDFRGGRTVSGRMAEVDLPVAVCLPEARNAYADALKDGDAFPFRGVLAAWDAMYDRGKFEGDLLEEPDAEA